MKNRSLIAIVLVLFAIIAVQTLLLVSNAYNAVTEAPSPTATAPAVVVVTRTLIPTFTPTGIPATPTATAPPTATSLPTSTPTQTPTPAPTLAAQITGELVNLRAGPGTDYAIIAQLAANEDVTVIGRSEAGDWVIVEPGEGEAGWLYANLVTGIGDLETLTVQTPDPSVRPLALVQAELVNLRSGPGEAYDVISQLGQGQALEVIGRDGAGEWLAVRFSGEKGWIFAELVSFNGDIDELPEIAPPPTPTPQPATPTPKPVALAAAVAPGQARVPRKVLANYFAWYDGNGWDACNISAGDKPLQPYHSDDPEAIARHVRMAIDANLDGFTLQWVGPGDRTDRNFATLLNKSRGTNFQSTVVFLRHIWPGANQGNTIEAIRYLQNTYAGHPNFLRINSRPVIFFTDVYRVPRPAGQSAQQAWATIRNQVDPGRNYWWIAEGLDPSFLTAFDGLWVYKVSHAAYPNDYVKASRWASRVRAIEQKTGQPKLWVGTLMPGWDDTRAGCRADIRVPSQPFVRPRQNGNFYRATYNAAVKSNPDLLWIHSFNEWVEGSYIEPSQRYGNTYMDLTREMASQFKGG